MSTEARHTGTRSFNAELPSEPIFDYVALTEALSDYNRPRDRITRLLEQKRILRLKKGLYCHADALASGTVRKELIANLLYGPSYVSLETGLALHRMIPEAVHHVTSVTTGKAKRYRTPVGSFAYRAVPTAYYRLGVERRGTGAFSTFLAATAEKALCDVAYFAPGIRTIRDAQRFLFDDMRVDAESFKSMDTDLLDEIAEISRRRSVMRCAEVVRDLVS
jgi:predicted transcriptional regulator of viral defense system